MAAVVEDSPVVLPKEEDLNRNVHQNYILSSQYESLDSDDLYTKYKKLQRQLEFYEVQEEYVKTELKNLKKEMLHAQEEIKRIQSVPLVIGQFLEAVDQNTGIVGSTTGSNYYVRILSTIDRELLKAGASVALHKHSNALVDILPPESDSSISMLQADEKPDVDYSDIGGLDLQKQEIREAVELPLTHFELYKLIGIDPPRGVLMFGPPGCGKTMLAKAVARHTTASFIRVVGSEFVQKYLGEGPRMVRDVFRLAKENSPAIIFIDEIDAIATKRFDAQTGADREVQRILLELLNQMDGFDQSINVKVIMATNRADTLDPALIRPGRLDRKIEFPLPDRRQKRLIFSTVTSKMNLSDEVDLEDYVARPDHISGADINSICQEAGMQAVRENRYIVLAKDFEKAYKNVVKKNEQDFEFYKILYMKTMSKNTGNNRISALKRLSKPSPINNGNRRQLIGTKNSSAPDARELLTNRKKSSFDARQLLSRQSSNTSTNTIVRKNLLQNKEEIGNNNGKMVVVTGLKDMQMKDGRLISAATTGSIQVEKKKKIFAVGPSTFVTIRNNSNSNNSSSQSAEKFSLTKTIKNPSVRVEDDNRASQTLNTLSSLSDQKVVISFVNDQYQKNPKPSQPTTTMSSSSLSSIQQHHPPPTIKRLHDASIQTTSASSSRSPIRMSSHRRHASTTIDDEDRISHQTIHDDLYEPSVKRTTSSTRKTTTTTDKEQQGLSTVVPTGSVKRTSTGVPINSRITSNTSTSKPISTTQSISIPGTILVTNLQPSVTEEDVIELFSEIGRINEITTLSQGCVQIVYAKREHAEQAVAKYHNRLLDGQFMYVSLQQSSSYSATQNPKITNNTQQPTKENGTSINSSSTTDQPLKLNATNNSSNKIVIDPAFIRQALFHPSNNSSNPVQFQVKL
ncbi:unnamed protein product [Rotaria sp. Silwood1]|nr:unnamed protein product [Rotaria sp. Silwood1]